MSALNTPSSPDDDPNPQPLRRRINPSLIPALLRSIARWVLWKRVIRNGKETKLPICAATGSPASSTDPTTWSTFEKTFEEYQSESSMSGIGFVLTENDPIVCVDLDNCVDEHGDIHLEAQALIDRLDSYTEYSPSGRGVHIFLNGHKCLDKCKFKNVYGCSAVEVYESKRYLTVTGEHLPGTPTTIEDRYDELDAVLTELAPPKPAEKPATAARKRGFDGDDTALIEAASNAKNGELFRRLWEGDTSGHDDDDSAADLALCNLLAFWTVGDPERIDRLFRQSGLYRDKWERDDYRERTIQLAIESCPEMYGDRSQTPRRRQPSGAPTVLIDVDEHRVIDEAIAALGADEDLYSRGGALVRVIADESNDRAISRPAGAAQISLVPAANLRDRLTRAVDFTRLGKDGNEQPAHPQGWLVKGVESRGAWPSIRSLTGVSQSPFIRPDGSVCQTPGYDDATGVLYMPSGAFDQIPEHPTRDHAFEALQALYHVVCDFRFEGEEHKSAWLAALLTPLARHAFEGPAPLFLVDANIRAAGKGLLCQTIAEIVLGRPMPVSSYSGEAEEMRKKITAIAIAGDPMVLLDNLDGSLGNDAIDRALTTTRWRDRILGKSEQVELPLTSVWYATGNNVLVGADSMRRIVHIRLDVLEERPEDRSDFQHPDLPAWIRANRNNLLSSAMTILAAYCQSGRPKADVRPMGSFEGWSDLVRQAVLWLGQPDPCAGRDRLVEFVDTSRETLVDLLDAIEAYDPVGAGIVLKDVVAEAYAPEELVRPTRSEFTVLRNAFEQLTGAAPNKMPSSRAIAAKLQAFRRRVIGNRYLDVDPTVPRRRGAVWRVFNTIDDQKL